VGREVVTKLDVQKAKTAAAAAGSVAGGKPEVPSADDYSDRLVKYIPAEVVGVYLFANGTIRTAGTQIPAKAGLWAGWIVFGFMAVMTPVYMSKVQNVKKKQQLLIVFFSFVVWVFTIGGPFVNLSWYHPIWGALLLPLYTFSIATFQAKK
jgi:hypothetical protein